MPCNLYLCVCVCVFKVILAIASSSLILNLSFRFSQPHTQTRTMSSLRVAARVLVVAVAGLCLSTVSAYSSQCKGGALQTLLRFSTQGAPIRVTSLSTAEQPEGMLSGLSRWKKAVYVDPVGLDASKVTSETQCQCGCCLSTCVCFC